MSNWDPQLTQDRLESEFLVELDGWQILDINLQGQSNNPEFTGGLKTDVSLERPWEEGPPPSSCS